MDRPDELPPFRLRVRVGALEDVVGLGTERRQVRRPAELDRRGAQGLRVGRVGRAQERVERRFDLGAAGAGVEEPLDDLLVTFLILPVEGGLTMAI